MSQEKAQLIAPEGTFTVPGLNVAGVVTGGNFVGNVTGSASSLAKGSHLVVGVLTASSFVGDVTGNVTGITSNTDNLILGEVTATSMVGDFTGIASGITGGPNITAGLVTATYFQGDTTGSSTGVSGGKNINVGTFTASSFTGDLTGNAAGLSTTTANLKLGITSATSFAGNLTGNASELAGTSANIKLGIASASSFAGDLFGNAANLAGSSARLKLGIVTATSFAGNLTGNAANLTGTSANLNLGIVTASSFAGNLTGNVASLSTNDANMRLGIVTASSFAGNLFGNAGSIASNNKNLKLGICTASSFAGNLTGNAAGLSTTTSHANLGIVTATTKFVGNGSNLTGVSGGPVSQQAVTANSSTTTIDLSSGNLIYMTQSANTTVAFANTEGNTGVVYLVRVKDDNSTARTITWPSGFIWDNNIVPRLNEFSGSATNNAQVFKLITRDNGITWYVKEIVHWSTLPTGYELWAAGANEYGELGQNSTVKYSSPVQIPGTDWAILPRSGTAKNLAVIKTDRTLWGIGRGTGGGFGQITSSGAQYSSPIQMAGGAGQWSQVSTGAEKSTIAVKVDGTVWAWGNNQNGQIANGVASHVAHSSPKQVGTDTTWGITSDTFGGKKYGGHIIKTDGTLWAWGSNETGIIGNNTSDNKFSSPVQIPGTTWAKVNRGGENFTGAIKTDGTLWMWGSNGAGQIGNNTQNPGGWGAHGYSSPVQVPGTNWRSLSANYQQAMATKTDGTLWQWGDNEYGELGQNNRIDYSSPVQVPGTNWTTTHIQASDRAFAIKTDGTLWAWGRNYAGQLGHSNVIQYSSPVQVPGTNWIDVWAPAANSIAFLRSS